MDGDVDGADIVIEEMVTCVSLSVLCLQVVTLELTGNGFVVIVCVVCCLLVVKLEFTGNDLVVDVCVSLLFSENVVTVEIL